jgi:starch synthase
MKLLFVSAEAAPFAKVGGLGDVAAALPRALARLGVEVALVLPKYRGVEGKTELEEEGELSVPVAGATIAARVYRGRLPGSQVPVYFLAHDPYFDRPQIYGEAGGDYPDSLERFAFLSRGTVLLAERLGAGLIHANDWHTALVPLLVRAGEGTGIKTVLTIHNLAYQGIFPWERRTVIGLPDPDLEPARRGEELNLLKGGILTADLITTVSPSYAREILERGEGLEEALRARKGDLVGVLNGVDYSVWNPETDPLLWANYSETDLSGKAENKRRLREELGLVQEPAAPLVGMVTRLAEQKGLDILIEAFDRMLALGIQFVILGTGDPRYEGFFRQAAARHRGQVAALITFSEEWAHRIEAASDIFLMPSRFEPCGLNQMYSLRYGTVPVVRATGGLADTVVDYDSDPERGNGFSFRDYTPEALLGALGRAVKLYRSDPDSWRELQLRGMRADHSWDKSAREYLALYRRLGGA